MYHRKYYVAANRLGNQQTVAYRKPAGIGDDPFSKKWTDEDWMEWQANNIAPRILIPKQTVGKAFQMVLNLSKQNQFVYADLIQKGKWAIEQFAGFYQVSKQSAAIRLQELGYLS